MKVDGTKISMTRGDSGGGCLFAATIAEICMCLSRMGTGSILP